VTLEQIKFWLLWLFIFITNLLILKYSCKCKIVVSIHSTSHHHLPALRSSPQGKRHSCPTAKCTKILIFITPSTLIKPSLSDTQHHISQVSVMSLTWIEKVLLCFSKFLQDRALFALSSSGWLVLCAAICYSHCASGCGCICVRQRVSAQQHSFPLPTSHNFQFFTHSGWLPLI